MYARIEMEQLPPGAPEGAKKAYERMREVVKVLNEVTERLEMDGAELVKLLEIDADPERLGWAEDASSG
jgi:hypothetical protein